MVESLISVIPRFIGAIFFVFGAMVACLVLCALIHYADILGRYLWALLQARRAAANPITDKDD
jgi:hypothetical protein